MQHLFVFLQCSGNTLTYISSKDKKYTVNSLTLIFSCSCYFKGWFRGFGLQHFYETVNLGNLLSLLHSLPGALLMWLFSRLSNNKYLHLLYFRFHKHSNRSTLKDNWVNQTKIVDSNKRQI